MDLKDDANSEYSDQPAHPRSLINVFAVDMNKQTDHGTSIK